MDETNKEKEILKSIEIAVKWWADRLDGTVRDVKLSDEENKFIFMMKLFGDEEEAKNLEFNLKVEKGYKLKSLYLFPAERKKFEQLLAQYIEKEIETKGFSYLCVGKGGAELTLARVARECEIECEEESVFTFSPNVEMFVKKDKVDVRFSENTPYETIYDEKFASVDTSSPNGKQNQAILKQIAKEK